MARIQRLYGMNVNYNYKNNTSDEQKIILKSY